MNLGVKVTISVHKFRKHRAQVAVTTYEIKLRHNNIYHNLKRSKREVFGVKHD
jgi:hypothetical protein